MLWQNQERRKQLTATIGSLYDETGKLAVLDTAMKVYKELPPEEIAGYASAFTGTPEYKESVKSLYLVEIIKNF